eukprot:Hpha_TRINITY_DN24749_c0_g1::TRINITY_DN24749_c0_g1_i1::g.110215::m.110215
MTTTPTKMDHLDSVVVPNLSVSETSIGTFPCASPLQPRRLSSPTSAKTPAAPVEAAKEPSPRGGKQEGQPESGHGSAKAIAFAPFAESESASQKHRVSLRRQA